jgi:hypothetical protein
MNDDDHEDARHRLAALKSEHRELDETIARTVGEPPFDQIRLQRLKKRKLALKDEIAGIENMLIPDIIA